MRILLWHVHGAWTTAFVHGPHEYVVPVTPDRGPDGLGIARTYEWPSSVSELPLEALGEDLRFIDFLNGKQLAKALRRADENSKLLIGGGDGTIATAASILGARKIPFGILPLGTMNLFAKDLGLLKR